MGMGIGMGLLLESSCCAQPSTCRAAAAANVPMPWVPGQPILRLAPDGRCCAPAVLQERLRKLPPEQREKELAKRQKLQVSLG